MNKTVSKPKKILTIILVCLLCLVVVIAVDFARLAVCFFALVLIATDFNPTGDWEYTNLPNGYAVIRVNSQTIVLCSARRNIRLNTYISSFCSNDRYIAVRWIDLANIESQYEFEKIRAHCDEAVWYLVDTTDDALYGPFATETAFEAACAEQGVGELGPWIDTVPRPDGSK